MNQFKDWLFENLRHLPSLTVNLFEDSLKCFFNEIERPAFLLAYQGVMAYVRDILLKSAPPTGWTEGEWQAMLNKTKRDDAWDTEVFNQIKNKGGGAKEAPLKIPDSVRSQFEFWRIQRNICAHYKQDIFLRAHVEAFYGFISHWLLRISVEGGLSTMHSKLMAYCDPSRTPFDESIDPIINIIPQYVRPEEYEAFLLDGIKVFAGSYRRDPVDFLKSILSRNDGDFNSIHSVLLDIIKGKDSLSQRLLEDSPKYVTDLFTTPEEIRAFWHDGIGDVYRNRLTIFATLLEAGKIPDEQKKEAISKVLESMKEQDRGLYDCDAVTKEALTKHGYFERFLESYVTPEEMNSGYAQKLRDWCYKSNFFIEHLGNTIMTPELVARVLDCFDRSKSHPYTIYDRIKKELWEENAYDFKSRFEALATENSILIPENWMK